MKVGIVRGGFLNPFEMQSFVPLVKRHEVVAFASLRPLGEKVGLPVVKLPSPVDLPNFPFKMPLLNRLLIDAHYLWGLEKKLKGFDIAHTAETYFHYTHQALKAKRRGWVKKVISTVWEVIPHNNEGIFGRRYFKKQAIKEVDRFLAVTQLAKQALVREGCNPEKITVIPVGIDLKRFHPPRQKRKPSQRFTLLFVGRLVAEKGVKELVAAFKKLKLNFPQLRLKVVGQGPLKRWLSQQGVEAYNFSYQQMPGVYRQADIFVLPSKPTPTWQEQFGMVLLEAMASGLPIVTTRCGAIPEVVGESAIVVPPGNKTALYQALTQLLQRPEKRKQLAASALLRAKKLYDRERVCKRIEKLYQQVLAQ